MEAIVLAGGLGTRLRSVVSDRPKPMALINNKPFLEYLVENLRDQGVLDFIFAVGYMHEIIEEYFEHGAKFGVNINYSVENDRLGTGGAIKNAEMLIQGNNIIILNGDTFFNVNLKEMYELHLQKEALFTMALRSVEDAKRYGAVEIDNHNKVVKFTEKGKNSNSTFINGGVYIINKKVLDLIPVNKNISLEQEIIPLILEKQKVFGYVSNEYFIDIGIPEDYKKFGNEFGGVKHDN